MIRPTKLNGSGPEPCQGVPFGYIATATMNAAPLLNTIVAALARTKLEAVLIGNAAAAVHGAPVTTLDFDFMFRETPANLTKLKRFADALEATILRPFYPISKLYRVIDDERGLQADFMPVIHGVKSFNSLRSRAQRVEIAGFPLWVAEPERYHRE